MTVAECDLYDAIVVGAGVVGPAIATALARQGRKVLIIERDWLRPDRIVGELMQPAGVKALRELGMSSAFSNINAVDVTGYYINFRGKSIELDYPLKLDACTTHAVQPVPDCVFDGNDQIVSDGTLDADAWEKDDHVRGIAFHHGDFLLNLRKIVRDEPNVTWKEDTVSGLLRDEDLTVVGVQTKAGHEYRSKLTLCCDGIYSRLRKELGPNNTPVVGLHFIGVYMKDADVPSPGKGHVILGDHPPVLFYLISPTETRVLCAYRLAKPPPLKQLDEYLREQVLPVLPERVQPAFRRALKEEKPRIMPNQYLPAQKQGGSGGTPGLVVIGDALNMRHPLTGGGMTVGLSDAVLMAKLLQPKAVTDLGDHAQIREALSKFDRKRKNLDAVINTLLIALYTLFAADRNALKILQNGCFEYFMRGGACVLGPIGLLLGMLPFPMLLFNHFFSVAIYAIYCNFIRRGLVGFPIALYEAFDALFTSVLIFTPYLWRELVM